MGKGQGGHGMIGNVWFGFPIINYITFVSRFKMICSIFKEAQKSAVSIFFKEKLFFQEKLFDPLLTSLPSIRWAIVWSNLMNHLGEDNLWNMALDHVNSH